MMPSLLSTSKVARAQFLRLPPSLRASLYASTLPRRNFSSSQPRKLDLLQVAIFAPTAVLDGIHFLGVPWWAAIPLASALIRCTFVYTLSTLPSRKRQITRTYLHPLAQINAKMAMRRSDIFEKSIEAGAGETALRIQSVFVSTWLNFRETHALGKRFGSPLFSWRSTINFGSMIAFSEAIRVKCGTKEGLLTMITGPFESLWERARQGPRFDASSVKDPAEALAERLEAAEAAQKAQQVQTQEIQQAGQDADSAALDAWLSGSPSNALPAGTADAVQHIKLPELAPPTPTYADLADPGMATEGLAWFQDLTVADPYHVLPFALGAMILGRISWKKLQKNNPFAEEQAPTPIQQEQEPEQKQPDSPPDQPTNQVTQTTVDARNKRISSQIRFALAKADEVRAKTQWDKQKGTLFKGFTLGDRLKFFFAAAFVAMGWNMPVGILLYILTNLVVGRLQRGYMDRKYPLPAIIRPCRRPLRIKVRRSFRAG